MLINVSPWLVVNGDLLEIKVFRSSDNNNNGLRLLATEPVLDQ